MPDLSLPNQFDYSILITIGIAVGILLFLLIWNIRLKAQITRKKSELEASEKKYQKFFFNAQVGLVVITMDDGKILECNDKFRQMVGYSSIEECKKEWTPDKGYADPEVRKQVVSIIKRDGCIKNYEVRGLKKDGSDFWAEYSSTAIFERGVLEAVIIDITDRKKAQESLKASEEKFRMLADNSVDVIWTMDTEYHMTYTSPAAKRIHGYSEEELTKMNMYDFLLPEYHKEATRLVIECLKSREMHSYKARSARKDGVIIDIALNYKALQDSSGNVIGIIGTTRDITKEIESETKKRELEKQLLHNQKMESLGTLAGGVAHDFNNILSAIFGYGDMILSEATPDSRIHRMQTQIINAAIRAKNLVQQILLFSRQTEYEARPIQIDGVVREVLSFLRSSIPTTVKIESEISDDCETILADSTRIHQVVMNLCTNAYHAIDKENGCIRVALKSVMISDTSKFCTDIKVMPGKYMLLEITDNGTGIEKENLEQIFNPYFTTKPQGKGTGLGLSVVHGIVRGFGGEIDISTELGKGSSFRIYFPVVAEDAEPEKISTDNVLLRGEGHILLLDDEVSIVEMLKESIQQLGYTVTVFTDAAEALEVFLRDPYQFDLVITDMTMPVMTGIAFLEKVFERRKEIPSILFTGFSDSVNRENAKAMGITHFCLKPVRRIEIAALIHSALED